MRTFECNNFRMKPHQELCDSNLIIRIYEVQTLKCYIIYIYLRMYLQI